MAAASGEESSADKKALMRALSQRSAGPREASPSPASPAPCGPTLLVTVDEPLTTPKSGVATPKSSATPCKMAGLKQQQSRLSAGHAPTAAAHPPTCLPEKVAAIVRSQRFECGVAVVILANCVTMGLEAQSFLKGEHHQFAEVAEELFAALFVVELVLRILVRGWRRFVPCLNCEWSDFLDAVLVLITGVLPIWVLPHCDIPDAAGASELRILTVLRALRLMRLIRVMKTDAFSEVQNLLRGMIESMRMLFWTLVVIGFITYIFAIFGVLLISVDIRDALAEASQGDDQKHIEQLSELYAHFSSVSAIMFTLVQVLTLDSWTSLADQVMKYVPWSWIFFYGYISLAVLVLMNIVTAVLVDHALANSKKDAEELLVDKEREREQAFQQFRVLFEAMDLDGSGSLSRKEFELAFACPEIAGKLRALDIQAQDCEDIFKLLDSGDGELSLEEFFEGLQRMEGTATAKDLFRVLKNTEFLQKNFRLNPDGSQMLSRCASVQSVGQPSNATVMERLDGVVAAVAACNANVGKCLQEVSEIRRGTYCHLR